MGYIGQQISIPLGQLGLRTDDIATSLPPNALVEANNIRLINNTIAKFPGSAKFNSTALSGGIIGLFDWFPTGAQQRLIAITSDGNVFRDTGDGTFSSGTAIASGLGSPAVETTKIVAAGNESAADNRKLFFFTASSQVKYIDGDAAALSNPTAAAADWATAFPTFGIMHRDRLWAFGNSNSPHSVYASTISDHSDWAGSGSLVFNVFPGEGDALVSAFVYKDRLFFFKRPFGMYFLNDSDPSSANWTVGRVEASFGLSSPHSVIQVLDDLVAGNATGSITSLKATDAFGDIEGGDILANGQVEGFVRDLTDKNGLNKMYSLYYPEKKEAYFTYRGKGRTDQNLMLIVDVNRGTPKFTVNSKESKINVLALRRDGDSIERPIYGDSDGFVFQMESTEFTVDGTSYTSEFKTPDIDFRFIDPALANKNKIFDFLTLVFSPTANLPIFVEVLIDGVSVQTVEFPQFTGNGLDDFELDTDILAGDEVQDFRKPINGSGKRISFRVFNTTAANFEVEQLIVGFRLGDEGLSAASIGG